MLLDYSMKGVFITRGESREINSNGFKKPGTDKLFHRGGHTPSYSTTTKTTGTWKTEYASPGAYKVVAKKIVLETILIVIILAKIMFKSLRIIT